MLRRATVVCGILFEILCVVPLIAQRPATGSSTSPVNPFDTSVTHRVAEFVAAFGRNLAAIAPYDTIGEGSIHLPGEDGVISSPQAVRLFMLGSPADIEVRGVGGSARRSSLSTIQWLDSLRTLWRITDDSARARWLFHWNAIEAVLIPTLIRLAETSNGIPELQRALLAFATDAPLIAKHLRNYAHANSMTAVGAAVTAEVAYVQGDTVHAIRGWLDAARVPRTLLARMVIPRAISAAAARHDTTAWLIGLTLRHLAVPAPYLIGSPSGAVLYQASVAANATADAQLQLLYHAYSAIHGTPPDITPARLVDDPLPAHVLSLDEYLDRQWIGLYDRGFPVTRAFKSTSHPSRLIVVEYATWPGCTSCWYDDRGLQPLSRRYPSDRVLTLAYPLDEPTGCTADSLAFRFLSWYPSKYSILTGFRSQREAAIPRRTLVTSRGDTLAGVFFVNGHGTLEDPQSWAKPDGFSQYERAIVAIDSELDRRPLIVLALDANTENDRITARVHIDSLQGGHRALAVRIVLFEDTVWVRDGTLRRIYQNIVRGVGQNDTLALGLAFPNVRPATVSYTFDVGATEQRLRAVGDPARSRQLYGWDSSDAEDARLHYRLPHPDIRDWTINRARLHVIAFVQDLATGEILQAVQAKVRQ